MNAPDPSIINIIASSSAGNAVLYFGHYLVDCGIPFKEIEPYVPALKTIFISHTHSDHFNESTIRAIRHNNPACQVICPAPGYSQPTDFLHRWYCYGGLQFQTVMLYHDILNFGFCFKYVPLGISIFHATDTAHLEGITAKDYDFYCLESNYDEETVDYIVDQRKEQGLYNYAHNSTPVHLSRQQAEAFFNANKHKNSQLIPLHKSTIYS